MPDTSPELILSKLDVAKRQLETAIRLYFAHADPVSIHTLTAAAYNVVRNVNARRGGSTVPFRDSLLKRVKPGHEKEVHAATVAAENFFKHADRDHDATLTFDPRETDVVMFDTIRIYRDLTGEMPPLFQVFSGWFVATYPDLFNIPAAELAPIVEQARAVGRKGYMRRSLPDLPLWQA